MSFQYSPQLALAIQQAYAQNPAAAKYYQQPLYASVLPVKYTSPTTKSTYTTGKTSVPQSIEAQVIERTLQEQNAARRANEIQRLRVAQLNPTVASIIGYTGSQQSYGQSISPLQAIEQYKKLPVAPDPTFTFGPTYGSNYFSGRNKSAEALQQRLISTKPPTREQQGLFPLSYSSQSKSLGVGAGAIIPIQEKEQPSVIPAPIPITIGLIPQPKEASNLWYETAQKSKLIGSRRGSFGGYSGGYSIGPESVEPQPEYLFGPPIPSKPLGQQTFPEEVYLGTRDFLANYGTLFANIGQYASGKEPYKYYETPEEAVFTGITGGIPLTQIGPEVGKSFSISPVRAGTSSILTAIDIFAPIPTAGKIKAPIKLGVTLFGKGLIGKTGKTFEELAKQKGVTKAWKEALTELSKGKQDIKTVKKAKRAAQTYRELKIIEKEEKSQKLFGNLEPYEDASKMLAKAEKEAAIRAGAKKSIKEYDPFADTTKSTIKPATKKVQPKGPPPEELADIKINEGVFTITTPKGVNVMTKAERNFFKEISEFRGGPSTKGPKLPKLPKGSSAPKAGKGKKGAAGAAGALGAVGAALLIGSTGTASVQKEKNIIDQTQGLDQDLGQMTDISYFEQLSITPYQEQKPKQKQRQAESYFYPFPEPTTPSIAQVPARTPKQLGLLDEIYVNPPLPALEFGNIFRFGGASEAAENKKMSNRFFRVFDVGKIPFGKVNVGLGYYEDSLIPNYEVKRKGKRKPEDWYIV